MKKTFKLPVLFVLALMLVCLTGCGSPASKVRDFCNAMNSMDFDKMQSCFEEDMFEAEDITDLYADLDELDLDDIFMDHAKKIKYKIGTVEKDEDDKDYATVDVTFTYDDYSEAMIAAFDEYTSAYDEDGEGTLPESGPAEILREHLLNDKPGSMEEVVTFYCEKVEGKWVVSYDFDVFDRVANALTCNLMDTYYEYDFEDFEDFDDGDDEIEDTDISNVVGSLISEDGLVPAGDGDTDASGLEDTEEMLDYLVDYLDSIEPDGMTLVAPGYTVEYDDDEECYVVTGNLYDYDVYAAWLSIVGTDGQFESKYPDTYSIMNDGLWSEDTELYIPKDAGVAGIWPQEQAGSYTAVSDLEQLLNSGHAFVYREDDYPDVYAIYDSYTNYAN